MNKSQALAIVINAISKIDNKVYNSDLDKFNVVKSSWQRCKSDQTKQLGNEILFCNPDNNDEVGSEKAKQLKVALKSILAQPVELDGMTYQLHISSYEGVEKTSFGICRFNPVLAAEIEARETAFAEVDVLLAEMALVEEEVTA
jgi:hypothetical protein